jgi:aryl-alcohol dehydrogenase-like predicted oxidoreductase
MTTVMELSETKSLLAHAFRLVTLTFAAGMASPPALPSQTAKEFQQVAWGHQKSFRFCGGGSSRSARKSEGTLTLFINSKKSFGVIPYFSLASGFLAGKYRSEADLAKSARATFVKKYLNERGFRILGALDQVAKTHSSTPTRVALAWLLAQPSVTAPIASVTNLDQLHELLSAADLKLDPESLEKLNQASAYAAGAGSAN